MGLENKSLNQLINPEFLGIVWIPSDNKISAFETFYELDHIFDGLLAEKIIVSEKEKINKDHDSFNTTNATTQSVHNVHDFYLTYLYQRSFFLLVTSSEEKIINHLKMIHFKEEENRNKIIIISKGISSNSKREENLSKKIQTGFPKLEFIFSSEI